MFSLDSTKTLCIQQYFCYILGYTGTVPSCKKCLPCVNFPALQTDSVGLKVRSIWNTKKHLPVQATIFNTVSSNFADNFVGSKRKYVADESPDISVNLFSSRPVNHFGGSEQQVFIKSEWIRQLTIISNSSTCKFCSEPVCKDLQCLRARFDEKFGAKCQYCYLNEEKMCKTLISTCLNNAFFEAKSDFLIDDCYNCCMASHDYNKDCAINLSYKSICLLFFGSFVFNSTETVENKKKIVQLICSGFTKKNNNVMLLNAFMKVKQEAVKFICKLLEN